ncbi:MAG: DUF4190 domain-containing protein [Streptosporangiaceae bacterium]
MTDSPQGPYDPEPRPTPYGGQHYRQPGSGFPQQPRTNVLAIVSLVTALLWVCGAGSLTAIICGHLGIREIDRSGGVQTGRGLALAGLIIGYLGLLVMILWLGLVVFDWSTTSDSGFSGYPPAGQISVSH